MMSGENDEDDDEEEEEENRTKLFEKLMELVSIET